MTSPLFPPVPVAGTFFPISQLPEWAQVASQFDPLHHCVELVCTATFGFDDGAGEPLVPRRADRVRGADVAAGVLAQPSRLIV